MTFKSLYKDYEWKEIYGCPGRYVLKQGLQISIGELTNNRFDFKLYRSPKTIDPFYIVIFPDGGLISYKKENGFLIHTLCDRKGFKRKIEDLDLDLNEMEDL